MENSFDNEQAKASLQQIIRERDHFRNELFIARQAITEMEYHFFECDRLLANAHRKLHLQGVDQVSPLSVPMAWIGTWRTSPKEYPALVCAEDAWQQGRLQKALSMMPGLLQREDLGHRHCVNVRLLYSNLIRSGGADLMVALRYAEEALQLATEFRLHDLAGVGLPSESIQHHPSRFISWKGSSKLWMSGTSHRFRIMLTLGLEQSADD